jgi:hypothetical protein
MDAQVTNDVQRARRLAAISALIAAALFTVGSALWAFDMPDRGTPAEELLVFYEDGGDRIVIGASLSLLAIAVFLLTAAAFRRVLIDAEGDDVLATTAFAGALLGAFAGVVAEGVNMMGALRAQDGELSGELARSLFEIPQFMGSYGAALGFGVFALATAVVAWRSGRVVPRYAVILIAITGVILLSPLGHLPEVAGAGLILLGTTIGVQLLREPPEPAATPTR